MLLNIMRAKVEPGKKQSFELDTKLDDSILEDRNCKFLSPVHIEGEFYYQNEKLYLNAKAHVKLLCMCDNCGEEFERVFEFPLEEEFIENYNSHNEEDYLINQAGISIDEPLSDNLLLSLSTRMLCREDCKGLCQVCGKNKNFTECHCEEHLKEIERQEENPFGKIMK